MTDYSKLIHDYLDTGLDHQGEMQLFTGLTDSEEMRREFYNEIKMMKAVAAEEKVIAPPILITNQIFNTLGFAIPTAAVVGAASRVNESVWSTIAIAFTTFFKDYFPAIISFVVGTSLAVAVMLGINNNNSNSSEKDNSKMASAKQTQQVQTNPSNQNQQPSMAFAIASDDTKNADKKASGKKERKVKIIPISTSNEAERNEFKKQLVQTIVTNERSTLISELQKLNEDEKNKIIETLTKEKTSLMAELQKQEAEREATQAAITNANIMANQVVLANNNNVPNAIPLKPISPVHQENSSLLIRYTGMTNMSGTNLVAGLTNMSFGGMYRIEDYYSIGFDIGNENFNLASSDASVGFEKKDVLWFAISNRFSTQNYFSLFDNSLYPIAEIKTGAASNGFIAKGQLGIEFTPERRTSMFVGIENGFLRYYNGKNWNSLNKNSIIFGLSYHF